MQQHFDALARRTANHVPLSPLSFLRRAETLFGDRVSVRAGSVSYTWADTGHRVRAVASALVQMGIGQGDTVSVLCQNGLAPFELHFAVPLVGAVLNTINTRLETETVAYILGHADSRIVIVDAALQPLLADVFAVMDRTLPVIAVGGDDNGSATPYEDLANTAPAEHPDLTDEWQAIALNYTSGTSGRPKGVVYHHRGAYLMALGTVAGWQLPPHPTYLSVVPMFHCNGWGHPWVMALLGGTMCFADPPTPDNLWSAIAEHGVTHFGAAPIVLQMLAESEAAPATPCDPPVKVLTAGAPPPPAVLEKTRALGLDVMQVYGLTETYGHISQCLWKEDWSDLSPQAQSDLQAQQGIAFPMVDAVSVVDSDTGAPVPWDGETQGEIVIRGNTVMKGYYKDEGATDTAFRNGWFWSGDAAVVHPDGYIQIRDRLKDVIISGGENISSVEVEAVLTRHPAVQVAAVVAMPHTKWGEVPCAFVELRPGQDANADEVIAFCRDRLAGFKTPKAVRFGPLPKTATGKIQKFLLRQQVQPTEA